MGYREFGDEPTDFINDVEFLDCLRDCKFLKKNSAVWSQLSLYGNRRMENLSRIKFLILEKKRVKLQSCLNLSIRVQCRNVVLLQ